MSIILQLRLENKRCGMMIFYSRAELEEMLGTSYEDFKEWERTRKVVRLKDAANKLVAVAENLTANKIERDVKNWGEFRREFLRGFKDSELLLKLNKLHVFFYEGLGYDEHIKDIEYVYHKARKELRSLVKHEKERKLAYA